MKIEDDPLNSFFNEIFDEEERVIVSAVKNKDLSSEKEKKEILKDLIESFKEK